MIDSARQRRALAEKERHSGILMKILEALTEIRRSLSELDLAIQQRKIVLALHRRSNTQMLISALPGAYAPDNEPIIYTTVKREFVRLEEELIHLLENSFSSALVFDTTKPTPALVLRTYSGHHSASTAQTPSIEDISHPMSLATTLAMLHQLGGLADQKIPQIVAKLTPFIDSFLVEPSSSASAPPSLKIEPRGNNDTALSVIESKNSVSGGLHAISRGLASTSTFIQFINDNLVHPLISETSKLEGMLKSANKEYQTKAPVLRLCSQLGAALLPILIDKLVRCCFESSIPEYRSQLEAYQKKVSEEVDSFVPTLAKFQWLYSPVESIPMRNKNKNVEGGDSAPSSTAEGWKSISKFVDFLNNSYLQFAIKKRSTYLAKARELILSGVYTSRSVGEIEFESSSVNSSSSSGYETLLSAPIFRFPRCKVRDVVIELVELAENLVSDALNDSEGGEEKLTSGDLKLKKSELNSSSISSNSDTISPSRNKFIPSTPVSNESKAESHLLIRKILLDTARDILDLYRAMVPALEKNKIANIPSLSMLFHNDCQYIAHHAALLGAKCRMSLRFSPTEGIETEGEIAPSSATPPSPSISAALSSFSSPSLATAALPVPLPSQSAKTSLRATTEAVLPEHAEKPMFSLAELVPAFRALAEQFYYDIVTAVRDHLLLLLDRMERLRNTDDKERKKKCLLSTRHIVAELESRDLTWGDTLPSELHKVTIGRLLNEVVDWMIDSALQIHDFSAPETESLNAIFTSLFPLARIFVSVQDTAVPSDKQNAGEQHQMINHERTKGDIGILTRDSCAKYVKSWLKFEDMADAFNMRMVELVERFNQGDFRFSRPQTISIIKALFQDSTKRSEQIASLRTDIKR